MAGIGPMRGTVIVNSYVEDTISRFEDGELKICDPADAIRIAYSIWALQQLANIFNNVLLVDASGYASLYQSLKLDNVSVIKHLELSKTVFLGKGFNEGAMFRCLTQHLGDEDYIMKVTSRYVVKSLWLEPVILNSDDLWFSALISGSLLAPQVDTRVVLMSRRFYEEIFLHAALHVNDELGHTLEQRVYSFARERSAKLRFSNFSLRGYCGHGRKKLSRGRFVIFIRMVVGLLRWKFKI